MRIAMPMVQMPIFMCICMRTTIYTNICMRRWMNHTFMRWMRIITRGKPMIMPQSLIRIAREGIITTTIMIMAMIIIMSTGIIMTMDTRIMAIKHDINPVAERP